MKDGVSVRTPAKINLTLDIIGKRNDGYHFLRSIMQSVSIYDTVTVYIDDECDDFAIVCDTSGIPCDKTNLVYKAAKAFFDYFEADVPKGITIEINKKIPQLAGLAGGSADAAATIVALNKLYEKDLPTTELNKIAEKVGSDVPFCVCGGTMLAEGVGSILSPLPSLPECYIVIAKPDNVDISTSEAYAKYDLFDVPYISLFDDIIASLAVSKLESICSFLFNALEVAANHSEINTLKQKMTELGAIGVLMTGSGSAVYGIFDKKRTAQKCADELSSNYSFTAVCTPCEHGAEIID